MKPDSTQSLLDKTDALMAKHRPPRGAIAPAPEHVEEASKESVPVLTQKISREEADHITNAQAALTRHEPVLKKGTLERTEDLPVLTHAISPLEAQDFLAHKKELQALKSQEEGSEPILSSNLQAVQDFLSDSPPDLHLSDSDLEASSESWIGAIDLPSVGVLGEEHPISDESRLERTVKTRSGALLDDKAIDLIVEKMAPELSDLVGELTREVVGSVLRQMTPRIQDIVGKRSRLLIAEALRSVNESSGPKA